MDQLNVTVFGLGNVGATIASLLISNTSYSINLNLVDPAEEKEGTVLDLSHSAFENLDHQLTINDPGAVKEADFIFHAAGSRVSGESSRLDLANENIQITRHIFDDLKFSRNPYIIVIANPLDVISYHTWHLSGLDQSRVIGIGALLDSVRLDYFLSLKLQCKREHVNAWILGEHGDSQVPIYSQTTYKNRNIREVLSEQELKECAEQTKHTAISIRKTQGASYYGAAHCAVNIFNSLLKGLESNISASVLINDHYKKLLGISDNLFLSLPVKISSAGFFVDNNFPLEKEEIDLLARSAKIINSHL